MGAALYGFTPFLASRYGANGSLERAVARFSLLSCVYRRAVGFIVDISNRFFKFLL